MWQTGKYVGPEGPWHAKIAIVGEVPSAEDEEKRRLFCGEAGRLLGRLLASAGLTRSECWIDSICPLRPAGDRVDLLPQVVWQDQIELLRLRLAALPALQLVVPLGNAALAAITGKTGITKWRGSLLSADFGGGPVKVLPSLHPKYLLRQPELMRRVIADFERVADEAKAAQPVRVPKQRNFIVFPSQADIVQFERQVAAADVHANYLAIDIETNPASGNLLCVGFSLHDQEAICIPFKSGFHLNAIRRLCASACPKVLHNGLYDVFWLRWLDIPVENWALDTLFLHAVLEPTEEHSLAHIASLFTDEPFWKDEAKDPKEGNEVKVYKPSEALYKYNCRDAAVTRELATILERKAYNARQLNIYHTLVNPLFEPLMDMMVHGIRIDEERRIEQFELLSARLTDIQTALTEETGVELFGKNSLSPLKLQKYLYETLQLPKVYNKKPNAKGEKSLLTDETTILKLTNKHPDKMQDIGPLILEHRRVSQLSKFYREERVDADGYFRFTLKPDTEAGRLSSKKSPLATGSNAQNIDREARAIYLPDEGHIFMEFDLSQVESRIVYVLSGDAKLMTEANLKPWEGDQHKENAALLFDISPAAVTKEQRQIGKITSHGAQRAMTGLKLQEVLLKGGYHYSVERCMALVAKYYETHPGILAYFQKIRWEVINTRALVNSWGRRIKWPFERLDDALFRKAYSFRPQSEAADFLNQRGLIPVARWLKANQMQSRLALTVHDSLLFSVAPTEAWRLYQFVLTSLATPLVLGDFALSIPVEVAIGKTWAKGVELKKPLEQDAFEVVIYGLGE